MTENYNRNESELRAKLEKLKSSNVMDARLLSECVELSESMIPEEFGKVFNLENSEELRRFDQATRERFNASTTVPNDKGLWICHNLFRLLALLQLGPDTLPKPPSFLEGDVPDRSFLSASLHLDPEIDSIDKYLEITLYYLGHEHAPGSGMGRLNEDRAAEAYQALCTQWTEKPQFRDWLVLYLSLRFMRLLVTVDLFHAMYHPLPHYREFKILAYLLWLVCRDKYQSIGQFTQASHELYYQVLHECSNVLKELRSLEEIQAAVLSAVDTANRSAASAAKQAITAPTDEFPRVAGEVIEQFFLSYIRELADAGRFHIVLWSVPMFEEVKDAFRALSRFGRKGFNILIIGETGTGKEAIAKLFLKTSGEAYVAVNCAGLSWDALYEDLFKEDDKSPPVIGQVSAVLLDELDRMHLDAQGAVLRFLDKPYGECRRRGHLSAVRWEGLTVATATERIFDAMKSQTFLPDLFWRFDVRAEVTPLRKMAHRAEFTKLFDLALTASKAKFDVSAEIVLTETQYQQLRLYRWPGNLREMLEFADSLVLAIASRLPDDSAKRDAHMVDLTESAFVKVFAQLQRFGDRV